MKRTARVLAFVLIAGSGGYLWNARGMTRIAAQSSDPVTITRMFTGADGLTHFEVTKMRLGAPMQNVTGIQFNRATGPQKSGGPEATGFEFHTAPHRRYVITLSGKAEIEASDGAKFIADPQHILVAEDLVGKGHRYTSRPLGNEDWIHVFVEIDQPKSTTGPR